MSSADQTKTRCASCASGARPTHGFRQGACGATVLFGVFEGEIVLGDEFSPDGCRLWDAETREKLDKDRFRQGLGGVIEAYEEVGRRLGMTF